MTVLALAVWIECPLFREKSLDDKSDVEREGTYRQLCIVMWWPV